MRLRRDEILVAFDGENGLRARVVVADHAVTTFVAQQTAHGRAAHALGRGAIVAMLYPTSFKELSRVSFQWSGAGAVGTVLAELRAPGSVRARVKNAVVDDVSFEPNARKGGHGIVPQGLLTVLRTENSGRTVSGQSLVTTDEIDEDAERYFKDSEQVATRIRARVVDGLPMRATGIIVQALPGANLDAFPSGADLERALADDVDTAHDLLRALGGDRYRVLETRDVEASCTCDIERIRAGLSLIEDDVMKAMIDEDGGASVTCDFCNTNYTFTIDDLKAMLEQRKAK